MSLYNNLGLLQGVVKVGAVNADDHKSLGSEYNIQGFPTIKIFGANKKKPEDYNGARSASSIVDAAINAATQKVRATLGGKKSSGGSSGDSKVSIDCRNETSSEKIL